MPLPKKVIPTLPLKPQKILSERRRELLDFINKDGTYLPKSVLHADLDRGMLDFVKEKLVFTLDGNKVSFVDRIITTQNWSQYTETALFTDLDYNPSPPFMTLIRSSEVKYGTNPSLQYTIPNRKQFYYASVPTWNGNVQGMDIYTIPQPVPVDIKYSVKLICNRMRELNQLNKVVMQNFSSRQSYQFIKGQYVPIILDNISEESQMSLESRKYFVQNYDFTMLGYLIDEEEFEVKPAIARVLQFAEVDSSTPKGRRLQAYPENPNEFFTKVEFLSGITEKILTVEYSANVVFGSLVNVTSYDVYINDFFYGTNVLEIQLNTNDILKLIVIKPIDDYSSIELDNKLV